MLAHKKTLFIITGPSGSGKTKMAERLDANYLLVSGTTLPGTIKEALTDNVIRGRLALDIDPATDPTSLCSWVVPRAQHMGFRVVTIDMGGLPQEEA